LKLGELMNDPLGDLAVTRSVYVNYRGRQVLGVALLVVVFDNKSIPVDAEQSNAGRGEFPERPDSRRADAIK